MIKKSKLPLIILLSITVGIFIGKNSGLISKHTDGGRYVNQRVLDKFTYILSYIKSDYVDEVDIDALSDKAIANFLEQLDPHSSYLTAKENQREQESLSGSFDGIGVQFRIIEDTVVIIQPIASGPSAKVGIMPGDRIITVDDSLFAGTDIATEDVMRSLKGEKGSKVKLGIKRAGIKDLISFEVIRDAIPTFSVDYYGMMDGNTGYIKLSHFAQTTHREVEEALVTLNNKGMKKLVFDLRGNGGGYLDQAYKVADEFVGKGDLIVFTQGRKRGRDNFFATSGGLFEEGELIVLIDELSASASEILAGAVQDNDRGLVIGRRTFGKGLVQEQKFLPDGSAVRLTVSRYHTPSGRSIQRPYIEGDPEQYFADFVSRYSLLTHGEKDSLPHHDSLKYKTKSGREVYGGGGIEPDIEIGYAEHKKGNYFQTIIQKGLLFRFCFDYVDKNRPLFKDYITGEEYVARFNISDKLFEEFLSYAQENGVSRDESLTKDEKEIKLLMKAYLAQNLFENNVFYQIYLNIDDDLQKALKHFKS